MSDLYQLLYVSSAVAPVGPGGLMGMLTGARKRNEAAGITGMLLYKDGNFMQAIEGSRAAVEFLFDRIRHDPRHRDVRVLYEGGVEARSFPEFSMAYRDLQNPALHATPGYSEFLNSPLTDESFTADPGRARCLLLLFKETM